MAPGTGGIVRAVEAVAHRFADDGAIPNNPTLPFLVYAGALDLPRHDPAAACEAVFAANGWGGSWRDGIYPFPHYHSTAHEVLGICRGEAKVRFGGDAGIALTVRAGDVVVIPAGVGHQNLAASAALLVVGAYPRGQRWDLCRGVAEERPQVLDNIARVPLPAADPAYGAAGPLVEHGSAATEAAGARRPAAWPTAEPSLHRDSDGVGGERCSSPAAPAIEAARARPRAEWPLVEHWLRRDSGRRSYWHRDSAARAEPSLPHARPARQAGIAGIQPPCAAVAAS